MFENEEFTSEVFQASYFAVSPGKNQAPIFRHASLPAPQQQLGNAVGVIDEIGRIRAVHIEINFFLFDELGELKRSGRDRDLAFDIRCGVELRGDVAYKIAKMLGELRLIDLGDDS